jgi:hypothetical protein
MSLNIKWAVLAASLQATLFADRRREFTLQQLSVSS